MVITDKPERLDELQKTSFYFIGIGNERDFPSADWVVDSPEHIDFLVLLERYIKSKLVLEDMDRISHYDYEPYDHAIACVESMKANGLLSASANDWERVKQYSLFLFEALKVYLFCRSQVLTYRRKIEKKGVISQEDLLPLFGAIMEFKRIRKEEETFYFSLFPSISMLLQSLPEGGEETRFMNAFLPYLLHKRKYYEDEIFSNSITIQTKN